MQAAAFAEVVQADDVLQLVVQRGAVELQFFTGLFLLHVEAGLQNHQRRAVQVHAGIPAHAAKRSDGFQRQRVGQLEIQHPGNSPVAQFGEVIAIGIARIRIAGDEPAVVWQTVVEGVRIDVNARERADQPTWVQRRAAGRAKIRPASGGDLRARRADTKVVQSREQATPWKGPGDAFGGRDDAVRNLLLVNVGEIRRQCGRDRATVIPLELDPRVPHIIAAFTRACLVAHGFIIRRAVEIVSLSLLIERNTPLVALSLLGADGDRRLERL